MVLYTQQRQRVFLEIAAVLCICWRVLGAAESLYLDIQVHQELYTFVGLAASLHVVSLTSCSVPSQWWLQCSLLTGHLSGDEVMSVLGGAGRKARPVQWQGIQMHRLMYPAVLEHWGKQQAFSVLLCQRPRAADSDAFLRLNYGVLLFLLFSSPAANCKTR